MNGNWSLGHYSHLNDLYCSGTVLYMSLYFEPCNFLKTPQKQSLPKVACLVWYCVVCKSCNTGEISCQEESEFGNLFRQTEEI